MTTRLSNAQIARYSRQLLLPELGVTGQQRLLGASVLVVGAGGLGSPAAWYLAAAGVGRLGLLDSDAVELSNLHRQILHTTQTIGRPKAASAAAALEALNPDVHLEPIVERLTADRAKALIEPYDVVLDGSDNFPTRYLVNDACVLLRKPFVHGAAIQFRGQLMTVIPTRSACYRCVFAEPPPAEAVPNCQQAGVLGAVTGVLGSLMAQEALKLILAAGEPMTDRLLIFDGLAGRFREVPIRRDPDCAVCGEHPSIMEPVRMAGACSASPLVA